MDQFKIEFYFSSRRKKEIKYRASIMLISKNFQLFKVSEIEKISEDKTTCLKDNIIVTSYPFGQKNKAKWKDASNFKSSTFLNSLGTAIEVSHQKICKGYS